jgi:hypothetical protein
MPCLLGPSGLAGRSAGTERAPAGILRREAPRQLPHGGCRRIEHLRLHAAALAAAGPRRGERDDGHAAACGFERRHFRRGGQLGAGPVVKDYSKVQRRHTARDFMAVRKRGLRRGFIIMQGGAHPCYLCHPRSSFPDSNLIAPRIARGGRPDRMSGPQLRSILPSSGPPWRSRCAGHRRGCRARSDGRRLLRR